LKKAKKDVQRFFPLIEAAVAKDERQIYVLKHSITEEERRLLSDEYGYEVAWEDDGDCHSSRVVGYYIRW
jgi:hypothetical protein